MGGVEEWTGLTWLYTYVGRSGCELIEDLEGLLGGCLPVIEEASDQFWDLDWCIYISYPYVCLSQHLIVNTSAGWQCILDGPLLEAILVISFA